MAIKYINAAGGVWGQPVVAYVTDSTLSDAAPGPILAQIAAERGFDNVGLIYRDDA